MHHRACCTVDACPSVRPQINQWDTDADLNCGLTLWDTVNLFSAETIVVLDPTGLPLRRLWCLYEISETPKGRVVLQVHGADAVGVAALFSTVRAPLTGNAAAAQPHRTTHALCVARRPVHRPTAILSDGPPDFGHRRRRWTLRAPGASTRRPNG